MKHIFSFVAVFLLAMQIWAQIQPQPASGPWQQKVKYNMDIRMDVEANRFTGKQRLEYTNQSPDTLTRLFYHLYWNAFQPNSMRMCAVVSWERRWSTTVPIGMRA